MDSIVATKWLEHEERSRPLGSPQRSPHLGPLPSPPLEPRHFLAGDLLEPPCLAALAGDLRRTREREEAQEAEGGGARGAARATHGSGRWALLQCD